MNNQLRDLSVIREITSLNELDVSENQIESAEGLELLVNMEKLMVSYNQINGIGFTKNMKNLREFHCCNCGVIDVTSLKDNIYLEIVALSGTKIMNIDVFKNLQRVKDVYLAGNCINNINPLSSCTQMSSLYLSIN